jgi:general secretion pathway protein H
VKRCRGFTLLEVLMVLVIVGAVLSMVGLVAPASPERQARLEAGQMLQLLAAGRESAVLEGREHGLQLAPGSYRLLRLEGGRWEPRGAGHAMPEGLRLRVRVAGLPSDLQLEGEQPQVLLLSSDEYSPFEIEIHHHDARLLSVQGDGLAAAVLHEG